MDYPHMLKTLVEKTAAGSTHIEKNGEVNMIELISIGTYFQEIFGSNLALPNCITYLFKKEKMEKKTIIIKA